VLIRPHGSDSDRHYFRPPQGCNMVGLSSDPRLRHAGQCAVLRALYNWLNWQNKQLFHFCPFSCRMSSTCRLA
jgi:hypothetical protein